MTARFAPLCSTSLRIQGVLLVDAGMFQCFASSAAGSAHAALRLKVAPPDLGTYGLPAVRRSSLVIFVSARFMLYFILFYFCLFLFFLSFTFVS